MTNHFFQKITAAVTALLLCVSGTGCAAASETETNGASGSAQEFAWDSYAERDAQWWSTEDALTIAEEIVSCQLPDGGWRKTMKTEANGLWNGSTIDNDATWGQILFLAKCHAATGKESCREACRKGIDFLLDCQYENGGWPQIPGAEGTYHAHITFNDNAMTGVMTVMKLVSERSGEDGFAWVDDLTAKRAEKALELALDCTLRCQILVNGKRTAWCQQYDEVSLLPAGGRAYEPPAISTRESVEIVRFLQSLPATPQISESTEAAEAWFREVRIQGLRFEPVGDDMALVPGSEQDYLWARFYDMDRMIPLFSDRSGEIFYDVREISKERRTGYEWYGTWPLKLLL